MAALKHLINTVDDVVPESLSGLCYTYPHLKYHRSHKIVLSPDYDNRKKVAILCGGGSGHEPFPAGFVGTGMLTAAIAGSIFAAPPSKHITHAIECVSKDNRAGIVMIVPNYTGDCLNFGIAIEKARQSGLSIEDVIIGEDCSIPEEEQSRAGKRGLTGMVFVIKIAGALAEKDFPLRKVVDVAKLALKNMATYAIGLSACSIPGEKLMFELAEDEIECGMGVHGEAGYEKLKLGTAADVVARMLKRICEALSLAKGDAVAAIINNFGALSQLEQGIVVHEVATQLKTMGIEPVRIYSGLLVTSLNSAGIHITLLKLPENERTLLLDCLDAPTDAPCWPGCAYSIPSSLITSRASLRDEKEEKEKVKNVGIRLSNLERDLTKLCLRNACEAVIEQEAHINELDRGCGDGDCGTTLKRLADGILQNLDELPLSYPSSLLFGLAKIAEESMGGSSGALYCLFFTAGAKELMSAKETRLSPATWFQVFRSGLDCLEKYGKARPGDRTMLDAMNAACTAYDRLINAPYTDSLYDKLSEAAWQGCESTKNMKPRAGRASYVRQAQYLRNADAGAYAAATWITAIAKTIKEFKQ